MIEKIILDFLSGKIDLPVHMEEPEEKPDRYILISKTGMTLKEKSICESSIIVQTIGKTLYEAAAISYDVLNEMLAIDDLPDVTGVSVNAGPYNFTDPQTHRYRYQTIYDIAHYL